MTALQRHIAFFDRNNDGVVTPSDTWNGFRELGYGYILSFMGMTFTHLFMFWPSQDNWIPRNFNIHVKNSSRCLHGSDSQVRKSPANRARSCFATLR
jgi:peroxygenase